MLACVRVRKEIILFVTSPTYRSPSYAECIDNFRASWLYFVFKSIEQLYERFTNPTTHSCVTLSSTTKLGLALPNKVMSTCELSKLGLDETKKEQWARVFPSRFFSSRLVRVLWVRLKRNKPGNRVIVSSMGCFIVQLTVARVWQTSLLCFL